jgi:hypothetical protein
MASGQMANSMLHGGRGHSECGAACLAKRIGSRVEASAHKVASTLARSQVSITGESILHSSRQYYTSRHALD